jgi:CRISPR-associated protein Csh2
MCNPNGDPDENKPRIMEDTNKNYVTDVRLKRTIRDYLNKVLDEKIFVRPEFKKDASLKTIEELGSPYLKKSGKFKSMDKAKFYKDHIDQRLFGTMFVVKGLNESFKDVGPVQFSPAQSLNEVETMTIRMTRVVPTSEQKRGGAFGDKHIVKYSFLEFFGVVNDHAAEQTNLSEEDVKKMLTAMWKGTTALATTSKLGQCSRLLVKINTKNDGYIGDLTQLNVLEPNKKIENITQTVLKIDTLLKYLERSKKIIESIEYVFDPMLECQYKDEQSDFGTLIEKWARKVGIKISELNL